LVASGLRRGVLADGAVEEVGGRVGHLLGAEELERLKRLLVHAAVGQGAGIDQAQVRPVEGGLLVILEDARHNDRRRAERVACLGHQLGRHHVAQGEGVGHAIQDGAVLVVPDGVELPQGGGVRLADLLEPARQLRPGGLGAQGVQRAKRLDAVEGAGRIHAAL